MTLAVARRRAVALTLAGAVSFAAAVVSPATLQPPASTAETTMSLLSVDASLAGADQSVDLTIGSGLATTDPSKNPHPLASLLIAIARANVIGQDVNSTPFDIETSAQGPGSDSKSDTELSQSFDYGDAMSGAVVIGARSVEVDDARAVANLGQVSLQAGVMRGLVVLKGVTIMGVADEADATKAVATQGVHIDAVYFFSLAQLLEQLGTSLSNLSIDGLLGLADDILGTGSTQAVRNALQSVSDGEAAVAAASLALAAASQAIGNADQAIASASQAVAGANSGVQAALAAGAEAQQDAAALNAAVAELTDGGIPGVTEPASEDASATTTILGLAVKYGVSSVGDPLTIAAAVALAIQAANSQAQAALASAQAALASAQAALASAQAALASAQAAFADAQALLAAAQAQLNAALAVLSAARAALEGTIGEKSLVTLRDVSVSVSASSFDGYSESDAGVGWGSAEVVGVPLPTADLAGTIAPLEAAVDSVTASLQRAIPGLSLTADIDFPIPTKSTGTEGAYQVATSQVTAFGINLSVGQSILGARSLAAANTFSLGASVLSLTARTSHRAGDTSGAPDPGDTSGAPDPDDTSGAPATEAQGSNNDTNPQGDTNTASPGTTPQGSPGSPEGTPGDPDGGAALPKTGTDAGLLMLLAIQLILLGWALERRQRLVVAA